MLVGRGWGPSPTWFDKSNWFYTPSELIHVKLKVIRFLLLDPLGLL